jgi:hypothetical protein
LNQSEVIADQYSSLLNLIPCYSKTLGKWHSKLHGLSKAFSILRH